MEKILTVSIAAYNVSEYIKNTLDSLIVPEVIDDLEVFIIDDGGKDETLNIAKEYERKYPNTFHAVHKENGGYGSTVNYSLKHASGKYFKLLDGDDWFDTSGLKNLIIALRTTCADIIITDYLVGPNKDHLKKKSYYIQEGDGIKKIAGFVPKKYFGMWPMTIKTEVLRKCKLCLPEHELYTDQYYCTFPLAYAKTIQYLNCSVYCYRTERDGQSTSNNARLKHCNETIKHAFILTKFYEKEKRNPNHRIILKRVGAYHSGAINVLLLKPISFNSYREIKVYDKRIKMISKEVYYEAEKAGETGLFLKILRGTGYLAYWLMFVLQWKIGKG